MAESIDPAGVPDPRIEDWEMVNGFSNSDDSKEKNERLKEVFTENSDMKRLMKVIEAQLNDLQARLEDKERELESKCKEMEERDKEIEYSKERIEKQRAELKKTKTLEELKEMKELLSERIISLTQDKVDLSSEVSDLKYKIFELTKQLSKVETKLSQIVDERDRLANKQPKKRKETKNRAALEEPEDEEKQILITQVNAYSRECDKLKGQLQTAREESNKKVSELTEEIHSLTCENRHTREREAEQLKMKLDEMQTEKARTLDENHLMREANRALLIKNKNLQSECDTLRSECDTLRSECDTKDRKKMEEHNEILRTANKELKNEIEELKNEMEELKNKHCSIIESLPKDRHIDTPSEELTRSRSRNRLPGTESDHQVRNSSSSHNGPTGRRIKYDSQEDSKDIEEMADKVWKEQKPPTTQEIFSDDGSRPYDPNLVCPKCGRQYREGEIQRLRRHINEFCIGKR